MIRLTLSAAVSSLALVAASASAQDRPDTAQPATPEVAQADAQAVAADGGVPDILVTAQRRSQRLSRVPISITAFDERTLNEARIQSLYDVASRTPNLQQTSQRKASPNIFIRGIGSTEDAAGGDRSVGVFIDDIYIGRGGATPAQFFDIARVEVLRGPQGTLYGRNVVGGALNITTNRPEFQLGYGGEITYGNYELIEGEGFLNIPIGDATGLRVAVAHSEHEGYAFNAFTGHDVDAENSTAVRVGLRFQPTSNLEVYLQAHYEWVRDYGLPRWVGPCGPLICSARFNKPAFGNIPLETDPRRVQNQQDGFFNRDNWGGSARIDWTTGIGTFTSITGYLNNDLRSQAQNGGVPDILRFKSLSNLTEQANQFSQEVRLASPLASNLNLTLGGYYYHEAIDRDDNTDRCLSTNYLSSCTAAATNLLYRQHVTSQSLAGYAELEFRPTESLTLIVGARYTHDWKDANLAAINLGGPIPANGSRQPFGPFQLSRSWDAFTPRAVVQYNFGPLGMAYATVSRGYKSGGYQGEAGNAASIQVPYDPEFVTNYEIGTRLQFFNRRVVLSVSGFVMKYTDLQVAQRFLLNPADPTSIVNATNNAARATIQGVEGEVTVRPFTFLDLWASGAYLHGRYDEFLDGAGGNFAGNSLPRVPEFSFNVGGRVTVPLQGIGNVALRADIKYRDGFYFTSANTNLVGADPFPALTLVDLAATFTPAQGNWELSLWAKNATNRLYRSTIIPVSDFINTQWAPPRTFGVTFRIRH